MEKNDLVDKVVLKGSRCEKACLEGPNMTIDGKLFNGVGPDNLLTILEETLLKGANS